MTRAVLCTIVALAAVSPAATQPASSIRLEDVTTASGIRFAHEAGRSGKKYLPETLGPGVAIFDADGDGWLDVFFANGTPWSGPRTPPSTPRLYRNRGDGTFADITRQAGFVTPFYALGAAAGDYDNDGDVDLFVTAMGQSRVYRNNGTGVFTDATAASGLAGIDEFSTSAAWLDYDADGDLDLYVANYVRWSPQTDIFCTLDGTTKSYCTPESYKGAAARLWRNLGDGRFVDATKTAGLFDPTAKALGVALLDYNRDGRVDLFVANDTQPNRLYHNSGDGTFAEKGVLAGVAFSEEGIARAGMGVDAADYDRSGFPSLIITNFSNQMLALYHNEGNGLFVDEAPRSTIGRATLLTLGFGAFFFDYDLDGWLDIFVANGHIESEIERIQKRVTYAQPSHVFRNLGAGRFAEVTASLGRALTTPRVGRGAAYGDLDNDGDLDVVVTTNGGPAVVLRNEGGANGALRVRLVGAQSNRDAVGAVVTVTAGTDRQWQMVRTGSSYLSQSELTLTFGLGARTDADVVEVRWPGGATERLVKVPGGQTITIQEGKGIVGRRPFASRATTVLDRSPERKTP